MIRDLQTLNVPVEKLNEVVHIVGKGFGLKLLRTEWEEADTLEDADMVYGRLNTLNTPLITTNFFHIVD